jgi:hypothetical protein
VIDAVVRDKKSIAINTSAPKTRIATIPSIRRANELDRMVAAGYFPVLPNASKN